MNKLKLLFAVLTFFVATNNVLAISEEDARKAIKDYAYYVYNSKSSEISYIKPDEVQQQRIFQGYKTSTASGKSTYAMDCNAFVGFIIYNALHIDADANGKPEPLANGKQVLNSGGRAAGNNYNGWSSHSDLYSTNNYPLKQNETVQEAAQRINLESKLQPGDLIGVVAFSAGNYSNINDVNKSSHIMVYVGNGKYIHNAGSGVGEGSISKISFANRVGSVFNDNGNNGPHGAITVLKLRNTDAIKSDIVGNYRFPDGNGNLTVNGKTSSSSDSSKDDGFKVEVDPEVNEDGYPSEEKEAGSNRVDYDNLCSTDKGVQKAFRIVGYVVLITRWAGPIAIIAFGVMDFVKAVYSSDEDATKKAAKSLGKRMISSIVIFLLPTILLALLNILEVTDAIQDSSAFSSCTKCVLNVKSCVSTESNEES